MADRVLSVRIDAELYDQLVKAAACDDRTLASLIRHLLRVGLQALR